MNQEILQELRDIHWPEPPSLWPLAIGYNVLGLLILCAAIAIFYLIVTRKKRRLKKTIRHELAHIKSHFLKHGEVSVLQTALTAMIRRIVFMRYPHASKMLTLPVLIETYPDVFKRSQALMTLVTLLEQDRFQKNPQVDGLNLLALAEKQVRRCRI